MSKGIFAWAKDCKHQHQNCTEVALKEICCSQLMSLLSLFLHLRFSKDDT